MAPKRKKIVPQKGLLMQGNAAVAEGALAAGIDFFGGYPITPSTEIAEILANRLPQIGKKFIQMEDEIASMASIIGASLAGAKAMTATSGPGFSLMQENLGFAAITEVPCVVVNVQRAGPSTGLPTSPAQGDMMQARWGTHGDHPIIALYPYSVQECFDLAVRAFNLAEKYRTPVILLLDEVVGHMRERLQIPAKSKMTVINRVKPTVPPEWYVHYEDHPKYISPMASFGEGYRFHITGLTHDRYGFPTSQADEVQIQMDRLKSKITQNLRDIIQVENYMMDDADIGIFAYGIVARAAKEAVNICRAQGIKVGLLRPLTIWPFPEIYVQKMLNQVNKVIVAELNQGQMIHEIERVAPRREGIIIKMQRYDGEIIYPETIVNKVLEVQ